ncbi:hypothetical protein INR49_007860 [Caranx melampygus]|nr:hypothetical protein INR49_007860 [Caranx melampygus]
MAARGKQSSATVYSRMDMAADQNDDQCFESPPACRSISRSSEDDEQELECSPELELKYPHIPRPSIIIRQPKSSRD